MPHPQWIAHDSQFQGLDIVDLFNNSSFKETMFVCEWAPYTEMELKELSNWSKWQSLLPESDLVPQKCRSVFNKKTSGNTIHHAYHLYQLEQYTNIQWNKINKILEIGAGYGNLARLIYNLGFRGQYSINDLPNISSLQKQYLEYHGIHIAKWLTEYDSSEQYDLIISTFALNEIPENERAKFSFFNTNYALFAYSQVYGGICGIQSFFENIIDIHPELSWYNYPVQPLHTQNVPAYYLIGKI